MNRLSNRLFYLPPVPETDRPALACLQGSRRTLLLDGGNSPAHLRGFLGELSAAGVPAPDWAMVTHRHWDHTFGLRALPENVPVIAGDATAAYLRRYASIQWGEPGLVAYMEADGLREFSEPHLRLEYPDPSAIRLRTVDVSFRGALELDLGDRRAVLMTVPSPHCDDAVIAFLPEERAVFLGDAWCTKLVKGEWVEDLEGLRGLWAALEPLDFDTAIVGHDTPQTKAALAKDYQARMAFAQ